MNLLKKAIENSPIVKIGRYRYFINPLQGIPKPLGNALLEEIVAEVIRRVDVRSIDMIVCVEAMSIGLGYLMASKLRKPIMIIRKKEFPLPGKLALVQKTGYSKGKLYLYGNLRGKHILIVDDLLSTGGTLNGLIRGLKRKGATVIEVAVVMDRGDGVEEVRKATGIHVKSLCRVEVPQKGRVVCHLRN